MKNVLKMGCYMALATLMSCEQENKTIQPNPIAQVEEPTPERTGKKKKIKLAILLDTSGSMGGLIEQAKNQLWKMVMQLAKIKDQYGEDPEIELALYQYGNDELSMLDGYVEKISGFTSELDEISEELFALRINGGSEYCGTVIKSSLEELNWSTNDSDLQIIFIAGNEAFTQGNVPYGLACNLAIEKGVFVNTVFCGDYDEGVQTLWKNGALLTNGKYMNIDHDAHIIHYDSPYDDKISTLNSTLNQTYVGYGKYGYMKKQKQIEQDISSQSLGLANATKRYLSKGSKVYKNTQWDLVDASDEKGFDIDKIEKENLPEEMQEMSRTDKIEYIRTQKEKRIEIKREMKVLSKSREKFVAQKRAEANDSTSNLDDVISSAINEQAQSKYFIVEGDIN